MIIIKSLNIKSPFSHFHLKILGRLCLPCLPSRATIEFLLVWDGLFSKVLPNSTEGLAVVCGGPAWIFIWHLNMKTSDAKPSKHHLHQQWNNDNEQMLSAHSIRSLNILNLSFSPFRITGSLAEPSKRNFPLPAKASKFTEQIRRREWNNIISRLMTVCVWAGFQLIKKSFYLL